MRSDEAVLKEPSQALPRSARLLFLMLSRIDSGRLEVVVPGGRSLLFQGKNPGRAAVLNLLDWKACGKILRSGDIGFAEAYLDGLWDTPDLAALLELAASNRQGIERAIRGSWLARVVLRLRHLLRANTRSGARRNIRAHYDLGNDFYRAWLDATMTYSAALFEGDDSRSLEQAQIAKYERILQRLAVRPGERILEIGCGWGGFAEHAARSRGARVHAITISREQHAFAAQRLASAGLGSLAEVELIDYRDVRGEFDHVVSIEMFEAVGESYWPAFFKAVRSRLKAGGRALIQSIVIDDELFEDYRRGTDFIQHYVFPGGMLPSVAQFEAQAGLAGLATEESWAFGFDYARTLSRWRARYNRAAPALRSRGFDPRFERMWNFYLAYCEAGFRARSIDVRQFMLSHA
jgi:cyclopropane-fatty-acyl-phospholipid synthase